MCSQPASPGQLIACLCPMVWTTALGHSMCLSWGSLSVPPGCKVPPHSSSTVQSLHLPSITGGSDGTIAMPLKSEVLMSLPGEDFPLLYISSCSKQHHNLNYTLCFSNEFLLSLEAYIKGIKEVKLLQLPGV